MTRRKTVIAALFCKLILMFASFLINLNKHTSWSNMNCNFHANIHITVNINMNIVITLNANGILPQLLTLMFISLRILTVIVRLKRILTLTTIYVLISMPALM